MAKLHNMKENHVPKYLHHKLVLQCSCPGHPLRPQEWAHLATTEHYATRSHLGI